MPYMLASERPHGVPDAATAPTHLSNWEDSMAKYDDLNTFVDGLDKDFSAFYDKNNKAAGTRVRKAMQDLKQMAQEIRSEVQDKKNTGDAK